MAETPEKKVKSWLRKRIKIKYPDAWIYSAPGGQFGRSGTPDLLMCIGGLFIAIEVKSTARKTTKLQDREILLINKAGGLATVIAGFDQDKLDKIFTIIDNLITKLQI